MSTVAGMVGYSASSCCTCASNESNADGRLTRRYRDGDVDAIARATVSRESSCRAAIVRIDKSSLLWRYLICARWCAVITHSIVVGWPIFKGH